MKSLSDAIKLNLEKFSSLLLCPLSPTHLNGKRKWQSLYCQYKTIDKNVAYFEGIAVTAIPSRFTATALGCYLSQPDNILLPER